MYQSKPIVVNPHATTLQHGPYCPQQYAEDAALMNAEQREAYHCLVAYQVRNGPIPDSLHDLRQACPGSNEWTIFEVLSTRYTLTINGYVHKYWQFKPHVMRIAAAKKAKTPWGYWMR